MIPMNKQEAIEKLKEVSWECEDNSLVIGLDYAQKIFSQIDEPQKVAIPKFVAEWIDELKKSHSNLAWVWQVYPNEPKVKNWLESNTEKFMRAWLDGYEVEQEKLYTVEIPDPYGAYKIRYLFRNRVGNILIGGSDNMDMLLNKKTHLTESEIKQDFEWAWDAGFAKPVESRG